MLSTIRLPRRSPRLSLSLPIRKVGPVPITYRTLQQLLLVARLRLRVAAFVL